MATTIIIDSERQKAYCRTRIDEMEPDGENTIEFKKTDYSPTAKQRRLRWMWMTEISKSGLGKNDTQEGADLTAKWMFARPILLRDNEPFGKIYNFFMGLVENSENRADQIKEFTRDYISIERLMNKKQEAEYLKNIQDYWIQKGVDLTDPALIGLDKDFMRKPKK